MSSKKTFTVASKDCFMFDPEKLVLVTDKESPYYDPRVEGDPSPELVESIKRQGVIQPIVVVKNNKGEAIVVDGRQRVKAALTANEQLRAGGSKTIRVPAIHRAGSHKDLVGVSISANEIRRDDDLLVKATKAQNLINMGYTDPEIAVTFGVTNATVNNWMAINQLASAVRCEIAAGNFAASYAPKLAKLDEAEQVAEMKRLQKEKAVKKPRGKKGAEKKAEKAAKTAGLRSKKECKALIEALGTEHIFVKAVEWVLGKDTDLTLYTCEECTLEERKGFFLSVE
jgi:ParB family chromosome partitioning protein